jgi:hypothetical protein
MTRQLLTLSALLAVLLAFHSPARAEDYPPGLMYSTLLNGVKIIHTTGQFTLDRIQAVFLPEAHSETSIYPYNPDDGGKLWAILSTTGGAQVYRFDFYGDDFHPPYWLLNSYVATDLRSGENLGSGFVDLSTPGDYVLDFYLESGRFYTFPFSVSTLSSSDPFAGGDYYFLNGPWEDWAYLYYRDGNPENSIQFKVWLRLYQHTQPHDVKPEIEVRRGGELVATTRQMTITPNHTWNRYEFDLIYPMENTSGGAYFKARDLLSANGDYTLTLFLDGQQYGTWKFKVVNGELNYTGRTVRGQADPLTFIEGGRDAWWYEKE